MTTQPLNELPIKMSSILVTFHGFHNYLPIITKIKIILPMSKEKMAID